MSQLEDKAAWASVSLDAELFSASRQGAIPALRRGGMPAIQGEGLTRYIQINIALSNDK
jgi:hypothetical protein